jgi:hypothetical protein
LREVDSRCADRVGNLSLGRRLWCLRLDGLGCGCGCFLVQVVTLLALGQSSSITHRALSFQLCIGHGCNFQNKCLALSSVVEKKLIEPSSEQRRLQKFLERGEILLGVTFCDSIVRFATFDALEPSLSSPRSSQQVAPFTQTTQSAFVPHTR